MAGTYRKPERAGAAVEALLKELGLWKAYREFRVLDYWADAAGEIIARVTTPESIQHGRLYVAVENSAWRNELTFYKRDIIERLNERAEEDVVKDIIFV